MQPMALSQQLLKLGVDRFVSSLSFRLSLGL